jgi:hypothetical protein
MLTYPVVKNTDGPCRQDLTMCKVLPCGVEILCNAEKNHDLGLGVGIVVLCAERRHAVKDVAVSGCVPANSRGTT